MGATADVAAFMKKVKATPDQTVETLAKRGLAWQNEIYSANAGIDLDIDWHSISEEDRESWREWAREKFKAQGITPVERQQKKPRKNT